jgi:hypothetical protein
MNLAKIVVHYGEYEVSVPRATSNSISNPIHEPFIISTQPRDERRLHIIPSNPDMVPEEIELEQSGWVDVADRVTCSIAVRLERLRDRGVDGGELASLRVVVTIDKVDQSGGVGAATSEAEGRDRGEASRSFGIAPGVLACRACECPRAVEGAAD